MRLFILSMLLLVASNCYAADAKKIKLTIYDDGVSCPANCDAHVVINPADNGTKNAYLPSSKRTSPKKCISGESCTICFDKADDSCMNVIYRGGGPPAGTFDFTPRFYDEKCSSDKIPAALTSQCNSLDSAAKKAGYNDRVNCFEKPDDPKCTDVLKTAEELQKADVPKRDQCLKVGEKSYNKAQTDKSERRSNNCNYTEDAVGGTPEKRWRKLLPAACRPGTYVDQFGLDCCSGSVRFAAANHPECVAFFPK